MINVWATYCGPCISEMPDLAKLNAEYKSKGVEIIGVVSDINANSRNKASSIVSKTGANYTHLVPCNAMKFLYDIDAVPTTIFVDSEGRQIGKAYVGSRSKSDWKRIIDSLLK